jgi:hypothetical protein
MPTSKRMEEDCWTRRLSVHPLWSYMAGLSVDALWTQTAKNPYRKLEKNIPRKGIARPQSQSPHSCVCERFLYSQDRSAYSAAGIMWTDPGNI